MKKQYINPSMEVVEIKAQQRKISTSMSRRQKIK